METLFTISQTDGRPMYLQIMEQIKQRVAVGDWKSGEKIPSIRDLAVALKVSVITIKRAYLELEREGVIITRHGIGSAVADDADTGLRLYREQLEKHLDEAARLAALIGLSAEELQQRISSAGEKLRKEQS
jgi:GntR family transcriptional regulator